MGTRTVIPVEQYLTTSFPDLDKEFRDGELVERSLPDYLHGETQLLIAAFFAARRKKLSLYACTETRLKLRAGLYLIPDVSVFHPERPTVRAPETPPLIAIDVLSPDDRPGKVHEKLSEFLAWGVPHVWLVDPYSKRLQTFTGALNTVESLRVPELGIEMTPADVFE